MCVEIQDQFLKEIRDLSEVSSMLLSASNSFLPYHIPGVSIWSVSFCPHPHHTPQQTKVYQHSCHNTAEAHSKVVKCKEKVDTSRGGARKKKAQDKELEV